MTDETYQYTQRLERGALLGDRYEIEEIVGRGGMGTVYRARDRRLDTQVAVKEMRESHGEDETRESAVRQFEREAKLLAQLSHPHLPKVTDYFVHGERWYLIMEYVQGTTLDRLIREAAPEALPLDSVLKWGAQIADVLDYLHKQDPPIVFRDVKPANVMVQDSGDVKLIDFGIARRFQHGATKDTLLYGSPGYSPPEQYGRAQTDPRSDIFALGATLHHLISGHDPAGSPFKFAPLTNYDPTLPPALVELIARCVDLDIENRIDDAAHIRDVLQRVRAALAVTPPRSPAASSQPERTPPPYSKRIVSARLEAASRKPWRPRPVPLLVGLCSVAALVLLAVWLARMQPSRAPKQPVAPAKPSTPAAQSAAPAAPAMQAPRTAMLRVTSEPAEARVFVAGRQVGVTPCEVPNLAAGLHVVRLVPPTAELLPAMFSVYVAEGQTVPVQVAFEYEETPPGASRSPVVRFLHIAEAAGVVRSLSPGAPPQQGVLITSSLRAFGVADKRLTVGAFPVDRMTGQSVPAANGAAGLRDKQGNFAVFADFDITDEAVDIRNAQIFLPAAASPVPLDRLAYRLVVFVNDAPTLTSDLRALVP